VAEYPTEGGKRVDRILLKLAEQIEREADARLAWLKATQESR
jgi:hypothetical protein